MTTNQTKHGFFYSTAKCCSDEKLPAISPRQGGDFRVQHGRRLWKSVQTLVLVSLGSVFSVNAAEQSSSTVPWVSLFNGLDLTGWKIVALNDPAPTVVEDGSMVLRQRANTTEHTFVTSEKKYSDFILELDVKDDPGFNSGILLRCADAPADAKVRLNGYQVKIDNTPRAWTGGVFDDFGGDWKWLFDLKDDARARAAFKLGEWAHVRIECFGPSIKVWVNGVPTSNLIDEKYREGYLAFKTHSTGKGSKAGQSAIRFKNIRILTEQPQRFAQPMDLVARRALPVPDENDGNIQLPDGFRATIVADNLMDGRKGDALRFLAIAPNGDVYAPTRKGGIFALRDGDGDGRAEIVKEFGAGGGTGVAVRNGWLYYSSASAVFRTKLSQDSLVPEGEPQLIAKLPEQNAHDAKAFAFDPEGNLFVDVGSPQNVASTGDRRLGAKGVDPTELQKEHGGIWRFKSDLPNQEQLRDGYRYASGLRHVLSLAWNPTRQAFFMVMMGRDQLSTVAPEFYNDVDNAEAPAEEMHLLREGGDVGWPSTYWDPRKKARMVAPEFGGDNKKQAEPGKYPDPVIAFPAHWAPMQMAFNSTQQFPNKYLDGAFIAFHGSWNRAPEPQRGYCIAFVPFGPDGMPVGTYEIFADGFAGRAEVKNPNEARFRPCGVAFGPDGTLYIGDSEKGRIWRVTYTGEHREKRTALTAVESAPAAKPLSAMEAKNALAYQTYCASCHMENGSGVAGMQPSLVGSEILAGDTAQLLRVVIQGPAAVLPADRPKFANIMPAMGFLTDAELSAALTHARTNFATNAPPITVEQVAVAKKANP
jgi:glucose/arabinose dehydrogenase/mono/diheme cytochrome c family protein